MEHVIVVWLIILTVQLDTRFFCSLCVQDTLCYVPDLPFWPWHWIDEGLWTVDNIDFSLYKVVDLVLRNTGWFLKVSDLISIVAYVWGGRYIDSLYMFGVVYGIDLNICLWQVDILMSTLSLLLQMLFNLFNVGIVVQFKHVLTPPLQLHVCCKYYMSLVHI